LAGTELLGDEERRIVLKTSRGVTLIELVVALSLFATLTFMAVPSMAGWLQSNRVRGGAQSILSGLQFAQAEAVSRNSRVRFQLTTSAGNDCKVSDMGTNWVVNLDPYDVPSAVEDNCAQAPSDSTGGRILRVQPLADAGSGATVMSSAPAVVFNGFGRPTPLPSGPITIDFGMKDGRCAVHGEQAHCMRIVVSPDGGLRMCDPVRSAVGSKDPQAC